MFFPIFLCGGGGRKCVHTVVKARGTSGAIRPPCFLGRGSSQVNDSRSVGNSLASEPQGPACQGPLSCWDLKRLPLLPALLWALGIELSSSQAASPLPLSPVPIPSPPVLYVETWSLGWVCWKQNSSSGGALLNRSSILRKGSTLRLPCPVKTRQQNGGLNQKNGSSTWKLLILGFWTPQTQN